MARERLGAGDCGASVMNSRALLISAVVAFAIGGLLIALILWSG
jgi:hypothetical protein